MVDYSEVLFIITKFWGTWSLFEEKEKKKKNKGVDASFAKGLLFLKASAKAQSMDVKRVWPNT